MQNRIGQHHSAEDPSQWDCHGIADSSKVDGEQCSRIDQNVEHNCQWRGYRTRRELIKKVGLDLFDQVCQQDQSVQCDENCYGGHGNVTWLANLNLTLTDSVDLADDSGCHEASLQQIIEQRVGLLRLYGNQ